MTDTTAAQPICRFEGCYESVHAEGICLDHYRQFYPETISEATERLKAAAAAQELRDAAPAPSGRLGLTPKCAIVRVDAEGVLGVYGAYVTDAWAEFAAQKLSDLGITGDMRVVPFYEVIP